MPVNGLQQLRLIKPELNSAAVHVFLVRLASFAADELTANLSAAEKARAAKLKIESRRAQFVITRAVLKQLLANCLDISPRELDFSEGPRGKPTIGRRYQQKTIEFNVSHSAAYALIALGLENRLGVDIESIGRRADYQSLSNRFFSARESAAFNKLQEREKRAAFYRVWTRKEAFLKATGQGLACGLPGFSVPLAETPAQTAVQTAAKTGSDWFIYNLIRPQDHQTALVADKEALDILPAQII